MRIEVIALGAAIGLFLAACQISDTDRELTRLARLMPGTYESITTPESRVLIIVPIWVEREAAHWFYVEQALSAHPARPFVQQIYRLDRDPAGELLIERYTLPDPESVVGLWRHPERLDEYAPSDLDLRAGCTVYLTGEGPSRFTGTTRGRNCAPMSAGAAYATIDLAIGPDGIELLERTYDAEGNQVGGPNRAQRLERR